MDHLEPVPASYGNEVLDGYQRRLRQILFEPLAAQSIVGTVLIKTSFAPERLVALVYDGDQHAIVAMTASRLVWNPQNAEALIPASRSERKIGRSLAVTLTDLWTAALQSVRPAETESGMLDGDRYEFSAGGAVGSTCSPKSSSPMGQLVEVVELLYKLVQGRFVFSLRGPEVKIEKMAAALTRKISELPPSRTSPPSPAPGT